jgi:bla regulator protein blaR1
MMMERLFISVLEISITTSIVILILKLLSSFLNKRYVAKWKYWIWMALAVRLVIPMDFSLPAALIERIVSGARLNRIGRAVNEITRSAQKNAAVPLAQTEQGAIAFFEVAVVIWILGCSIFLLYHLASYFAFKREALRWSRTAQNRCIQNCINSLSAEMGIERSISVYISEKVSSPMIIGFVTPILILPYEHYSNEDLAFILKHELIHFRRRDTWYKLLLASANAVHWFNPLVYLMTYEANADLELSCDDEVIRGADFDKRKAYSETILSCIQQQRMRKTALSTYFYGGTRIMKERFVNILNMRKKNNGMIAFCMVLVCILLIGGFAANAKNGSDPAGVVKSYLENLEKEDYVISLKIQKVEISNQETERIRKMYSGSELAQSKGWSEEYIKQNIIAVAADYTVDYDNTKVPYNEGALSQFFYLNREDSKSNWTIFDSMSPSEGQ